MSTLLPRLLLAAFMAIALASCQSPTGGGGSSGRDVYGARPGPKGFSTVVIDAGHGGRDSGARSRYTGQLEKTLALDLAERLRRELSGSFRTVMIRDSDHFVPLEDRATQASRYGNGVLVSIHLNSGSRRLSGIETFYWRVDSYSLAKRIQTQLTAATQGSSNSRGLTRRRLRLTRNPQIPCVLVECGYLSNHRESHKLAQADYRARLANALANAIRMQAHHGDDGMGPLPQPIYAPPSTSHDRRE